MSNKVIVHHCSMSRPQSLSSRSDRHKSFSLSKKGALIAVGQFQSEPQARISLRSKTSSSNSSDDRAKILRNCCRKTVEFLFTQVGVGALVVCYSIVGAFIFQSIEGISADSTLAQAEHFRRQTIVKMWNLTDYYNTLNKALWSRDMSILLKDHQDSMVRLIKAGYDSRDNVDRWSFPAAMMFTLSVITMIGYGHLVPRTEWGKIAVMIYACIGIPVYILYFLNIGRVLAKILKWVYTKAYKWNLKRKWNLHLALECEDQPDVDLLDHKVIVPSTACLWVMVVYLLIGTILYAEWENWNYLDSVYFCVTSLLKIGLGDLVPGVAVAARVTGSTAQTLNAVKLVITFVYLLLGMGIVAMCYYLLKELVSDKLDHLRVKLNAKCLHCKAQSKIC